MKTVSTKKALAEMVAERDRVRTALETLTGGTYPDLESALRGLCAHVEELSTSGCELETEIDRINAERAQLVQKIDTMKAYFARMLEEPSFDPKPREAWRADLRKLGAL